MPYNYRLVFSGSYYNTSCSCIWIRIYSAVTGIWIPAHLLLQDKSRVTGWPRFLYKCMEGQCPNQTRRWPHYTI